MRISTVAYLFAAFTAIALSGAVVLYGHERKVFYGEGFDAGEDFIQAQDREKPCPSPQATP